MSCCIQYLCQTHHDFDLSEGELSANLLFGLYRLHEYAISMWFKLMLRYHDLVNPANPPRDVLDLLQDLIEQRSNDAFVADAPPSLMPVRGLYLFKNDYPDIYHVLCSTSHFYKRCFDGEYDKQNGE